MQPEPAFIGQPVYKFQILDERETLVSELELFLPRPSEVLMMATVITTEIQLSHPDRDCRNWSVEVTAPNGSPFTSLLFNYIALYGKNGLAAFEAALSSEASPPSAKVIDLSRRRRHGSVD